jgi:hypothetical protein
MAYVYQPRGKKAVNKQDAASASTHTLSKERGTTPLLCGNRKRSNSTSPVASTMHFSRAHGRISFGDMPKSKPALHALANAVAQWIHPNRRPTHPRLNNRALRRSFARSTTVRPGRLARNAA